MLLEFENDSIAFDPELFTGMLDKMESQKAAYQLQNKTRQMQRQHDESAFLP